MVMKMKLMTLPPDLQAASLELITASFKTAAHADGNEADLTAKLRKSAAFCPDFEVGALTLTGQLVGYGLLSAAQVAGHSEVPLAVLAPLAVHPDWQRQGVGRAVVQLLEQRATQAGMAAVSILGDPAYYQRFGYQPASRYGVEAPFDVEDNYFMLKVLQPESMATVTGKLIYDSAFGV